MGGAEMPWAADSLPLPKEIGDRIELANSSHAFLIGICKTSKSSNIGEIQSGW
jgi:hypothetical protein